jgi:hypothetical protein
MADFDRIFGGWVASGLGLGQPTPVVRETAEEYDADPAGAFSRTAERFQPPGGAVPYPFGTTQFAIMSPDPGSSPNHKE